MNVSVSARFQPDVNIQTLTVGPCVTSALAPIGPSSEDSAPLEPHLLFAWSLDSLNQLRCSVDQKTPARYCIGHITLAVEGMVMPSCILCLFMETFTIYNHGICLSHRPATAHWHDIFAYPKPALNISPKVVAQPKHIPSHFSCTSPFFLTSSNTSLPTSLMLIPLSPDFVSMTVDSISLIVLFD